MTGKMHYQQGTKHNEPRSMREKKCGRLVFCHEKILITPQHTDGEE